MSHFLYQVVLISSQLEVILPRIARPFSGRHRDTPAFEQPRDPVVASQKATQQRLRSPSEKVQLDP